MQKCAKVSASSWTAVKFCEWNIVQRAKPIVPLGAIGIYEGILYTFPNVKLLFICLLGLKHFFMLKKLPKLQSRSLRKRRFCSNSLKLLSQNFTAVQDDASDFRLCEHHIAIFNSPINPNFNLSHKFRHQFF